MLCEKIKLYEDRDDVTLTTYIWDDSVDMKAGKKRPAVIVCPGGAYLALSDKEGEPVALAFANMGYQAFVLKYSVYSEGNDNGDMFAAEGEGIKEHCQFPKPMQDIGAAMLYIRKHSDEWRVNMDQVAVCGFSAGAHNCALYSVYYDQPEIAGFFGAEPALLKPAACILGYSLTDYAYKKISEFNDPMMKKMFELSDLAFMGTQTPDDKMLWKVSPVYHVNENTPPVFLWATCKDNLVPVQHTILMARALADAKVPFEVHIFEDGYHGLGTAQEAGAGCLWDVDDAAAKWVPMCHTWLKKRFTIELDEKPFWA